MGKKNLAGTADSRFASKKSIGDRGSTIEKVRNVNRRLAIRKIRIAHITVTV